MKPLRLVFMGTPDFAVESLKKLVHSDHGVVAVITAPDRPAGRGRKLQASAVKKYAIEQGLPIMQPTNLKDPSFLNELKSFKADLQIVVAFRMLPKSVWSMPPLGTFNLHASLLPRYRGAAPINWAIIQGEKSTGVTTFFLDEKIDTGNIILQKETSIPDHYTAGDLHDDLMIIGSDLVLSTVNEIASSKVISQAQNDAEKSEAPKLNKENCRIDWTQDLMTIHNHIRGLSPYPAAWTTLKNGEHVSELKIYKSAMIPDDPTEASGTLVATKKTLMVAVKGGYLELMEIKLAGKKKMAVKDFLNGTQIFEGANLF